MGKGDNAVLGRRLAEERARLGIKQAEFAAIVGCDAPKQSLYETGTRELRAAYLARLHKAGVDVLYVLTGTRHLDPKLGEAATAMLGDYLALPPALQAIVGQLATNLRRAAAPVVPRKTKAPTGKLRSVPGPVEGEASS